MVAINEEDLIGPCIVTVLSSYQMATFQKNVGKARKRFKVAPPITQGEDVDEGFLRVYRAHQNCVETYAMFLGSLWSCSLLLHQVPASIVGVVYMYGRARYFRGYSNSSEKRMPGFKISMACLVSLGIGSVIGCGMRLFRHFRS